MELQKKVKDYLEKAGYPRTGKVKLIDGRTGEYFDNHNTVGRMYMLKRTWLKIRCMLEQLNYIH